MAAKTPLEFKKIEPDEDKDCDPESSDEEEDEAYSDSDDDDEEDAGHDKKAQCLVERSEYRGKYDCGDNNGGQEEAEVKKDDFMRKRVMIRVYRRPIPRPPAVMVSNNNTNSKGNSDCDSNNSTPHCKADMCGVDLNDANWVSGRPIPPPPAVGVSNNNTANSNGNGKGDSNNATPRCKVVDRCGVDLNDANWVSERPIPPPPAAVVSNNGNINGNGISNGDSNKVTLRCNVDSCGVELRDANWVCRRPIARIPPQAVLVGDNGDSNSGTLRWKGPMRCKADRCGVDLTGAKTYNRRHRICDLHAKAAVVSFAGVDTRFCQQCSRFHEISEFDGAKRSCRERLDGHNRRRRKDHPDLQLRMARK